jgi:predicted O-methyltransferase YrrM
MVDECFKIPINKADKKQIDSLIDELSSDVRSIEVADFGAGSKKLKKQRKISSILRTSSSKGKFAKRFYQFSAYYQPKKILEFGTSLGIGTIHFANGNPTSEILTIEACPQTATIAQENFKRVGVENVRLLNTTFRQFLSDHALESYDLLFIDGHHDGKALLEYVDALEPYMKEDSLVILDDIRWSNSMHEAWKQLVEDERFHVTIDFFRMGVIVKRPQQRKEHFVLK